MKRKYRLTNKKNAGDGQFVWQIQAVRDIFVSMPDIGRGIIVDPQPMVREGEYGGWVSSEDNLSHEGSCWIYDKACAVQHSRVLHDARLSGFAAVMGYSVICKKATVSRYAVVKNFACISGNAVISDLASVYDNSYVAGNGLMCDHARAYGNSTVFGHMSGSSSIAGGYLRGTGRLTAHMVLKDELYSRGFISINTSDGYTMMVNPDTGTLSAGCRFFKNEEEAVAHWVETRAGTPLGNERLQMVRYLYAVHRAKQS